MANTLINSALISACEDGNLRHWDMESGKCIAILNGHSASVSCLATTLDGHRVLSGSDDKSVKLWDIESGSELACYEYFHCREISCLVVTPDGRGFVSGSYDKLLALWDLDPPDWVHSTPPPPPVPLRVFRGHTDIVTSAAVSDDGSILYSGSEDRSIGEWDICTGQLLRLIPAHGYFGVSTLSFSGSLLVSGGYDNSVKLWQQKPCQQGLENPRLLSGHKNSVSSVAFFSVVGSCGELRRGVISGGWDNSVRLWDVDDERQLKVLGHDGGDPSHTNKVFCVSTSSDGILIASGGKDNLINVWHVNGQLVGTLRDTSAVRAVIFVQS
jgi:WD40 repeat protein